MLKNLTQRILSGIIIGAIFIFTIFFYRPLFIVLMIFVSTFMLIEWYNMTHKKNFYLYLGLIIIPLPIISILYLSNIDHTGYLLLNYFAIIWCVDIFAMWIGKTIGGPKLAPNLSPNKTISGLCGGVLAASILPLILNLGNKYSLMIEFALIAFIAQMSDLFISFFKRKFKIKDSGNIIPGHGGMLDRFDAIILTAPIVALFWQCVYIKII